MPLQILQYSDCFLCHLSNDEKVDKKKTANLRKWREHPDANLYIQEAIESNLGESHSKFADAAPALAERLIHLGLSPDARPMLRYSYIKTILISFNNG